MLDLSTFDFAALSKKIGALPYLKDGKVYHLWHARGTDWRGSNQIYDILWDLNYRQIVGGNRVIIEAETWCDLSEFEPIPAVPANGFL